MTSITFRNGIMASDSSVTQNDVFLGKADKLFTTNLACIGISGPLYMQNSILTCVDNFFSKKKENICEISCSDESDTYDAIVYEFQTNKIWSFSGCGTRLIVDSHIAEYYAIGSGRHIALGAFAAGASAIEAVTAACRHDTLSALPVRAYDTKKQVYMEL